MTIARMYANLVNIALCHCDIKFIDTYLVVVRKQVQHFANLNCF